VKGKTGVPGAEETELKGAQWQIEREVRRRLLLLGSVVCLLACLPAPLRLSGTALSLP
jgi:hypothetical protein